MGETLAKVTGTITLSNGGTPLTLPFHEFLEEVSIEIVPSGAWTGTITVFDIDFDKLERAIIASERDRNIDIRFGWDSPSDNVQRNYQGWIIRYQPEFQPHGTNLNFEIMARAVGPAVLDKKIRSFAEGRRASDIVKAIATERGWLTTDLFGNSTIEDTEPPLETPFSTKGESDLAFIKEQLLKQAQSRSGSKARYLCYFDEENAIHFHTPEYLPAQTHVYRFARDADGEVNGFAVADTSVFGVLSGGGNTKFSSPTSAQGGTAQKNATVAGGLDNAGTPNPVDAAALPSLGSGTHSYVNIVARNPEEVERVAAARFDDYRRIAFQANLNVRGTHRVRLTDFIRVEVLKPSGELHYLSGQFQVFKIKHTFGAGSSWTTEFEMVRGGIQQVPGTEPVVASPTVSPGVAGNNPGSVGISVEP